MSELQYYPRKKSPFRFEVGSGKSAFKFRSPQLTHFMWDWPNSYHIKNDKK